MAARQRMQRQTTMKAEPEAAALPRVGAAAARAMARVARNPAKEPAVAARPRAEAASSRPPVADRSLRPPVADRSLRPPVVDRSLRPPVVDRSLRATVVARAFRPGRFTSAGQAWPATALPLRTLQGREG